MTAPEEPIGINRVKGDKRPQCGSFLNIAGEDFQCDLTAEHDGWSHKSSKAVALWQ